MNMKFIEENLQKYKDEMMKLYKKSKEKILENEETKKEKTNSKNKSNQRKKNNTKKQSNENKCQQKKN